MSYDEFNSNIENMEDEILVYGGTTSSNFVAALKTREPDNSEFDIKNITGVKYEKNGDVSIIKISVVQDTGKEFDKDIEWNNFMAGIFSTAEYNGNMYTFTFKETKPDEKDLKYLTSTNRAVGQQENFKKAMWKIINHAIAGTMDPVTKVNIPASVETAASSDSGNTQSNIKLLEMSLNAFGELALYNKMKNTGDDNNLKSRDEGLNSTALLSIKTGDKPEINDDMKNFLKKYLIVFNFITSLLIKNKTFDGNGDNKLKVFLPNVLNGTNAAKPIQEAGSVFGQAGISYNPRITTYGKINCENWINKGMYKDDDQWKYDSYENVYESGYTMIMEMINYTNNYNTNNSNEIYLNLDEVRKLLIICLQENKKNEKKIEDKTRELLIKSLNQYVGEKKDFKDFLTASYDLIAGVSNDSGDVPEAEIDEVSDVEKAKINDANVNILGEGAKLMNKLVQIGGDGDWKPPEGSGNGSYKCWINSPLYVILSNPIIQEKINGMSIDDVDDANNNIKIWDDKPYKAFGELALQYAENLVKLNENNKEVDNDVSEARFLLDRQNADDADDAGDLGDMHRDGENDEKTDVATLQEKLSSLVEKERARRRVNAETIRKNNIQGESYYFIELTNIFIRAVLNDEMKIPIEIKNINCSGDYSDTTIEPLDKVLNNKTNVIGIVSTTAPASSGSASHYISFIKSDDAKWYKVDAIGGFKKEEYNNDRVNDYICAENEEENVKKASVYKFMAKEAEEKKSELKKFQELSKTNSGSDSESDSESDDEPGSYLPSSRGSDSESGRGDSGGNNNRRHNGSQKTKTLKRRKQQKNKSHRRFAYGGRKAYDQRKKKRQQDKQQKQQN